MKAPRAFLTLALVLTGCTSTRPPLTTMLNAGQASMVARRLANERAHTLYGSQPFWDGAPARLVHGEWVWNDGRAYGIGDLEARVVLAADGSPRSVDVLLMNSQLDLF